MFNPSIAAPLEDVSDQRVQDAAYYRGVLHELIAMGTDLARLVHRQAMAQADPVTPDDAQEDQVRGPAADAAIAGFERIARSVRRCILLAQKLDEPVRAPVSRRDATRRVIIRSVEDAIQRHADGAEAESLHAEFLDRLDGPDLDEDVGDRPVAEIIADICRDLGLGAPDGAHPWKRRTPGDIAVLCARAAAVGVGAVRAEGFGGGAEGAPERGPLVLQSQAGCRGP